MPYQALIAALLEEGEAKATALITKARMEADRLIANAKSSMATLDHETRLQVQNEVARQRTLILCRASLTSRHILLQAKHEVLDAVWERGTNNALALTGKAREQVLRMLLDELLTSASPGSLTARIDSREERYLKNLLSKKGISYETQHRDDLLLGIELEESGVCLTNSLATRLNKAKPELTMELYHLLFHETEKDQ
jgi:vacuolar-type H+-ATPase subunit E/Vma4